jgi:hypothetical protein
MDNVSKWEVVKNLATAEGIIPPGSEVWLNEETALIILKKGCVKPARVPDHIVRILKEIGNGSNTEQYMGRRREGGDLDEWHLLD